MKKIKKSLTLIIGLALMLILTNGLEAKAALQANKNTQYKKTDTIGNWIEAFRQMETVGEAMGLKETLGTNLTATSESNNIDVHMMKSTEYGAIAILSASGYGNPSNSKAITSTTGNNTGMILKTTYDEFVAAGWRRMSGVNTKYFDVYPNGDTSAKRGDALGTSTTENPGAAGWHSATTEYFINNKGEGEYLVRGNGGIFSFSNYNTTSISAYSRGVAVCGVGL